MEKLRVVEIKLSVYVPAGLNEDEVEGYINDRLYDDPEFFGYIDQGCITLTNQVEDNYGETSNE